MTRDRMLPFATLGAGVLCLSLSGFAEGVLPSVVRVILCGSALFFVPGFLLLLACRLTGDIGWLERPGVCFALSLGMLAVATLPIPMFGLSLNAALPILFVECAIAAGITLVRDPAPRLLYRDGGPLQERLPLSLLAAATVALTVGAWLYTDTGSVDRWWYLAYVREFLDAQSISGAEPFLGSGNVLARFTWNTWLLSFAAWAHFSATDPTNLYEHTSALFLAPIAVSAAVFLGRTTFDSWRLALITGLSSILIWTSGSLLPAMTRLPEDKLLAILILAPVFIGAIVRAADGGRHGWSSLQRRNWIPAVAILALAVATVHPFVYGVSILVGVPFLVLFAVNRQTHPSVAAVLVTIILLIGGLSFGIGSSARDAVVAGGAAIENLDHPVVRVHMSQDRLIDIGYGHIVSPKLLLHPLIMLGFLALLPLVRRSYKQRYLITPATFIALSVAFLAPLTWLAGQLVLPWMVYRVLWAIPFALLLTVAIDEIGRLTKIRPSFVAIAIALVAFPWLRGAVTAHERPERQALAAPRNGEMTALTNAVENLSGEVIIAAAPRLSERIPGLTGKYVLALSDRGTIVFAGDRENAEKRLQARTAALIGLWRPVPGVPDPTHIIFSPGSPAERYCGETFFKGNEYQLCAFSPANPIPGVRLHEAKLDDLKVPNKEVDEEKNLLSVGVPSNADRDTGGVVVECSPAPEAIARTIQWKDDNPWTATVAGTVCTFTSQDPASIPLLVPRNLIIAPFLGYAAEEFVVSAKAWREGVQRWNLRTRSRIARNEQLEFEFPQTRIDKLEVSVTPAYLPFLKLHDLSVTFENAAEVKGKDAQVQTSTEDDIAPNMNVAEKRPDETTTTRAKPLAAFAPVKTAPELTETKKQPLERADDTPAKSAPVPAAAKVEKPASIEQQPKRKPAADAANDSTHPIEQPQTAVAPTAGGIVLKVSSGVDSPLIEPPKSRRAGADLGTSN